MYPLSSEVTAGQPTAADHYNDLRRDALLLGNADADSKTLAQFFKRYSAFMTLQVIATNRLRVAYATDKPPTLMINGVMLQAGANVDLPSAQFTGDPATWYVFAVRSAGSSTFTLAVNTSSAEATDQRLIGEAVWDGTDLVSVLCYLTPEAQISVADYDSGWFAVSTSTTYTKTHGLGQIPRLVLLTWSSSPVGAVENIPVIVVTHASSFNTVAEYTATLLYATTGDNATSGTLKNIRKSSGAGYYRFQAWK